ncbi:pectate lyase [Streptomyces litchfieldiae]|uniref:Pectate lyase n=1 Tax=Streptomyces litchfieldiae TaxID=3075543 RepID=A0ABU2MWV8_9ACTN|nr:pectate lyase [Streptomyces sp. DSM 44938]MDT0346000.1 pectate lyase [Streptomyces sp. DSM 44938]
MTLSRRTFMGAAALPVAGAGLGLATARPARARGRDEVVRAMRRAATFMDEEVSYRGAYVWSYLPDLSASWGEMTARRSMCWVQPPGTPVMGHCLLDAYHATGEESFRRAAERTGRALVAAQLPSGGWNYVHDFAGEGALREWYATVGANGWRLEEFQHYYGNATFDDAGTSSAGQLLLWLYLERRDRRFGQALKRAIGFVLRAQFRGGSADGGWPQRFPEAPGTVEEMPRPALGLRAGEVSCVTVWRHGGEPQRTLPLPELAGQPVRAEILYPAPAPDTAARSPETGRTDGHAAPHPDGAAAAPHPSLTTRRRAGGVATLTKPTQSRGPAPCSSVSITSVASASGSWSTPGLFRASLSRA